MCVCALLLADACVCKSRTFADIVSSDQPCRTTSYVAEQPLPDTSGDQIFVFPHETVQPHAQLSRRHRISIEGVVTALPRQGGFGSVSSLCAATGATIALDPPLTPLPNPPPPPPPPPPTPQPAPASRLPTCIAWW